MGLDQPLQDGARIGVIGAGPAGTFFAISALQWAKRLGRTVEVAIFERKPFDHVGPRGCNMCAGAIGGSLLGRLQEMGLPLGEPVVRHEVKGYTLHGYGRAVTIVPRSNLRIATVFRGGGPPPAHLAEAAISFDQHLLNCALERGARLIPERVQNIIIPRLGEEKAQVRFGSGSDSDQFDLLVGAFGVNTNLIKRLDCPYRPPRTWHTCQAEIRLGRSYIQRVFGDTIHFFPIRQGEVRYVATVPRGDYLTVVGIGRYVRIEELKRRIAQSDVAPLLPEGWQMICHCHPQIPVSSAYHPFTSRLVIVGDAAYSRYLKNGIESALLTARYAADAVFTRGVSSAILAEAYDRPCRAFFVRDNRYGKLLFALHDRIFTHPLLSRVYLQTVEAEQRLPPTRDRPLSGVLWHLFSGDLPYGRIFRQAVQPRLQWEVAARVVRRLLGGAPCQP